MMNGVTSPSRPWFRLRVVGFLDDENTAVRIWLDEVQRRMLLVMAESNFYNALAVLYLDLVIFGTGAMLIYEDPDDVIRCYNNALGEYYLGQSHRQQVDLFAREFCLDVRQVVDRFGLENCSPTVRALYERKGGSQTKAVDIVHLIEPNKDRAFPQVPRHFEYREIYWERGGPVGEALAVRGFREMPGIFPRWEIVANDAYGSSPAMDALGDVIQLQHETKRKAQAIDLMNQPPMVADIQLQNKPTALLPRGVTYVANANGIGMKPAYQVQPPIQEFMLDIREVQGRIREIFHNDLFRMISQLDTVRSATEIDARREEKLVLLGPVLERFENEALDPAIERIYRIMTRANLLPPPPPGFEGAELEIQYVSVLSDAQRAVATVPIERFLALTGNLAAVYPKALNVPDFEELLREYGTAIGVPAKGIRPREAVADLGQQQDELRATQEASQTGLALAQSGELLSKTEVGGGRNAVQALLGG
jgi:hypothetical protein